MGSSKAAFCGILQGRRDDASRWARLRRLPTGFSNGGAARSAAVPFCPSLPRRPGNGCRASVPAHANRRAVPSLFHIFLPPGRTSFFTQPSCQRYRAPLFLHPFVPPGGRDSATFFAACTGGGAVRSLFALSAARPALYLFFYTPPPAIGCRAPLFLHPFVPPGGRDSAAFFTTCPGGGAARSLFALSAARPALHLFFYTPPPGKRMPRVRSRPCEPAGSPFPFPHFPTARPYFFLYPAVLPAMPHATFPASFCPAGRQGQRRFLCRLHGRRSGALPFRPIGGAPGTAPLFLHPAARGTDAARPFPPMRTGGQSLLFPLFSARIPRFRAAATHGSFPLLLRAAAPAASLLRFPPRFAFRAAHSCARVPSAPVSSVPRCLVPRRRALYPALFLRGRTHRAVLSPFPSRAARLSCPAPPVRPACAHRVEAGEAVKPAAARSCTPGPVPARADASRRFFAFPHARRAPFLPCAPCAPGLCASRRGGESCKASCCALLHARPALKQRARNRRPASASPRARPVRPPRTPGTSVPPRTPGTSVPPRTPGASVPLLAAVRFGSHSAVQSLPIFFHRPAGKRTQKANLIRTYVRIRF